MTILLIGKNGLFGQHFTKKYPDIVALGRQECDITNGSEVFDVIKKYAPTIVINAAGVVPKSITIHDPLKTLATNSLAVKKLAQICSLYGCKLIHLSSNDVFSGLLGNYSESDLVSPTDLYGMSKVLGEVIDFPHLTVRSSFVGFPDNKGRGLLAWEHNTNRLVGFDKFLWNGITALELSTILMEKIVPDMNRVGLLHIHGQTLSKYDVLVQAKEVYGWDTEILKESEVALSPHVADKTLRTEHGIISLKSFKEQLIEMKEIWT